MVRAAIMPEFKLISEIIRLSAAETWDRAKLEWQLMDVQFAEEPETCLCGHFPIIEICTLRNSVNGKVADVGNCCVKKFIGLPSDKIFDAVKRISRDDLKSANAETIQHAFDKGWITGWERNFYLDIMRKRSLSEKQSAKKKQINRKILARIARPPSRS